MIVFQLRQTLATINQWTLQTFEVSILALFLLLVGLFALIFTLAWYVTENYLGDEHQ